MCYCRMLEGMQELLVKQCLISILIGYSIYTIGYGNKTYVTLKKCVLYILSFILDISFRNCIYQFNYATCISV